jgi:molybdate transport system permease protein
MNIGSALLLSLQVTLVAMFFLLTAGVALGWLFARVRFPGRLFAETIVYLPLVLPPTVVGYFLLLLLGRGSPLHDVLGLRILFTWQAAAAAAVVVGLPLIVQTTRSALDAIEPAIEDAARTLGASEWSVFRRITLPLARHGIIAGALLAGARALGEFGATLMVAGNIPGRTQTMPLAIYDAVQMRDWASANLMVLIMTSLAFVSLFGARMITRRTQRRR